ANAAAKIVEKQDLLRFGETEFPRNAGMLDRTERRCAGPAAVATDEHDVGMGLGDSSSDRADSDLRDKLYGDARLRIHVLQVVDQLRKIFDRIDVVMRWRRDEPDAGDGVPQFR